MSKVYIVRLSYTPTHREPLIRRDIHCYVNKAKSSGRSACSVRVRRGQWRADDRRSAMAFEFDTLAAAKRVLKSAAIKEALINDEFDWRATVHLDVTTGRRKLFQNRQLMEVWPKPNAIELLAEMAG